MGYFDYLEEKTKEQREFQYFDVFAKTGTFIGLGALLVTLAAIFVFAFAIPFGGNIWLDFLVGGAMIIGAVGIGYSAKAVKMARSIRKVAYLGNFALVWGIFVILINIALLVINTWLYFV